MKQISCITCQKCCRITIDIENGEQTFSGNKCENGTIFAKTGQNAPARSLKIMVRTVFPDIPVLSVRTSGEIPKNKIKKIVKVLSKVLITERMKIGDIVVQNISRTGCDIIATSDMYCRSA